VGWVGSWIMIVVILWVGLGLYVCGLGWVVSYKNGPMDNLWAGHFKVTCNESDPERSKESCQ